MKVQTSVAALLITVFTSGTTFAQNIPNLPGELRFNLSQDSTATAFSVGIDEQSQSTSTFSGQITYQADSGFFGELGFGKSEIVEVGFNGRSVEISEKYSTRMFGLGYRVPLPEDNRYWGIGYQNSWVADDTSLETEALRAFWEKNTAERYGIIDLSLASADDTTLIGVAGQHVWFVSPTVGLGVNWGIGSGNRRETGTDTGIGVANFGAVFMFRPKL